MCVCVYESMLKSLLLDHKGNEFVSWNFKTILLIYLTVKHTWHIIYHISLKIQ